MNYFLCFIFLNLTFNLKADDIISKQFKFWNKIFSTYGENQVLIHDTREPWLVIDLIDHNLNKQIAGFTKARFEKEKRRVVRAYVKRYQEAILNFKQKGIEASKISPMESRIFEVYKRSPKYLMRLLKGEVEIRSQSGLLDEFYKAIERSKNFMPTMESIFIAQGLPPDITRLSFVESMFNLKATSKVGAVGVWQFMGETAQSYMKVSHLIDERKSPIKATKGAAQLLKENFNGLNKNWALAITAYNHGRGSIERAIKELKTTDLNYIIENYKNPNFGFASQNFYAEFLAAKVGYEKLINEKIALGYKPYLFKPENEFISLTIPKSLSINDISSKWNVSKNDIKKHNPCLNDKLFTQYANQKLPANYELFFPKNIKIR